MDVSSLRYARLVERDGLSPVHEEIISLTGTCKRVLDVGCSTGYVGRRLIEDAQCTVDGVELDPEAAAVAAETYRRVFVGSLEDPALLASIRTRYDVILLVETLEHVVRPERVLTACAPLLDHGGYVLVTLPNVAHWAMRWKLLRGHWRYEDTGILDHTHLRFYTFDSARELLDRAGYHVVEHRPRLIYLPFESRLRRFNVLRRLSDGVLRRLRRHLVGRYPNLVAMNTILKGVPVGARSVDPDR
jgi:2-polyprenyl-3-methyl-5-hydroxy-6-metoxy-1,4-benzoquinol methylase